MITEIILTVFLALSIASAIYYRKKYKQNQSTRSVYLARYLRLRNDMYDDIQELAERFPNFKKYYQEVLRGDKEFQEFKKIAEESK